SGRFTTVKPAAIEQLSHYVTIAHLAASERNARGFQRLLQTKVAHLRANDAARYFTTHELVARDDVEQFVAIHLSTSVIDHDYAVAITIESNAEISLRAQHFLFEASGMRGSAFVVDIESVWLIADGG